MFNYHHTYIWCLKDHQLSARTKQTMTRATFMDICIGKYLLNYVGNCWAYFHIKTWSKTEHLNTKSETSFSQNDTFKNIWIPTCMAWFGSILS